MAQEICRRMADVVPLEGGALLLEVDPRWAGAIGTVLVSKGVRVKEVREQTTQERLVARRQALLAREGRPRRGRSRMAKVSMEVGGGAARLEVGVMAEGVRRAVSPVKQRDASGGVKARYPLEPESSYAEDPSARRGLVGLELTARVAA